MENQILDSFLLDFVSILDQNSSKACLSIIEKLKKYFPIKGASFYSYAPPCDYVVLRAQAGFSYLDYNSLYKKSEHSILGKTLSSGQVCMVRDLANDPLIHEKNLVQKYHLVSGIFIPLNGKPTPIDGLDFSRSNLLSSDKIGVIALYPEDHVDLEEIHAFFNKLKQLITKFYITTIRTDKLLLRQLMINKALQSADLNSFLFRTLRSITEYLGIEAASVFLWDQQGKLLRLHATTGLTTTLSKHDIFYPSDSENISVNVARTGEPYITDDIIANHPNGLFAEKTVLPGKSYLAVPIYDWSLGDPNNTTPLGVLRAVNKRFHIDGRDETVPFTWEDISNFALVTETISMMSNFLKKSEKKLDDFERIMHGVRSNIEAVLKNLQHFEDRPNLMEIKVPEAGYIVPDSISHMLDVKWQIERMLGWQSINIESKEIVASLGKVMLFGQVLSKVVNLSSKLTTTYNVKKLDITNLTASGFNTLPPVRGNTEALITVFKNLLENALKYSDPANETCMIELLFEDHDPFLDVIIRDNGIGVPEGREQWIFVEGYRGENAIRRRPAGGSGIGLSQSKSLMDQMGGDLFYKRDDWTTFIIRMKKWDE
ncbi:MAG TPA: ATP-binding protein [bacterium]|mgnify:CR=1 FL=1|nr:ATP-binding protein [bacterium]HOZ21544.1 ATP-binding protein [bacterium]HPI72716.1 ATP-binding protein [bacterium]